jgi:Holliday junction resolvase-like predicted endonuclease
MAPKIEEVEVEEKELEDLLVEDPEAIERGMKILGRQIQIDSGPLDVLAVDEDGALTLVELKSKIDDGQLDQGLRYYDWVRSNIQWTSRNFKEVDAEEEPRLILIAPAFSENLRRIAKYVDVNLDLIEYRVIHLPDGKRGVLCHRLEIGGPPEPPVVPTREGNIKRIENEEVRQLCAECVKELENKGIEIRPLQGWRFSIWYKGKRFMRLRCKKKFFVCEIQKPDGLWTRRIRITTKKEWEKVFNNEVMPTINKIESN